ncbi:hypothetical protein BCR44DRAFT_1449738 [Catenaria anguillulae PL171]|uniref:Uncharacterized protein n=1 Tax=Catenaria anguillulae PL171 TaxID=765915 RepID=A0A1Y2H4J1_9FUNG|nr:hypothetical protein BCR44DRAFT_1449738 [Catenaria anguillulae PL171]
MSPPQWKRSRCPLAVNATKSKLRCFSPSTIVRCRRWPRAVPYSNCHAGWPMSLSVRGSMPCRSRQQRRSGEGMGGKVKRFFSRLLAVHCQ